VILGKKGLKARQKIARQSSKARREAHLAGYFLWFIILSNQH
jgi:hypothetical protein